MIKTMTGSWSAAELPHRVSQMYVEDMLRRQAQAQPTVSIRYGWRIDGDSPGRRRRRPSRPSASDGRQRCTFRAVYAVGADGSRSFTRKALGLSLTGEGGAARDFLGGPMSSLHFRSGDLYDAHSPSARLDLLDRQPRPPVMPVRDQWRATSSCFTPSSGPASATRISRTRKRRRLFHHALGRELPIDVVSRASWNAGYTLVADRFGFGRIFLGGDAAHLFTPTGGLGYNTAVEDAVNLGWKLAATLKGYGGPELLGSYEIERQALARRNTAYARGFADSVGLFVPADEIEDDSPAGAAARQAAGEHLNAHSRAEFNIPGITFGGRYDGSPIVVPDGTPPPPDSANTYVVTACPGGRAPHLWLADGRSLYDSFGFEFTLLRLGPRAPDAAPFAAAAKVLNLPLAIVDVASDEARDLYQADLALIRPDQIVAWRGNSAEDATRALRQAVGH